MAENRQKYQKVKKVVSSVYDSLVSSCCTDVYCFSEVSSAFEDFSLLFIVLLHACIGPC